MTVGVGIARHYSPVALACLGCIDARPPPYMGRAMCVLAVIRSHT